MLSLKGLIKYQELIFGIGGDNMIEVRIPKEIREYKEKLFFGLNLRQTITTALAIAVCVPLYILGQKYISVDVLSWIIIGIAAPLILIGYFNFNQMPFEKFIVAWFKMQWLPQKRPFKYEPVFWVIKNEIIQEELDSQKAEILENKKKKKAKNKTVEMGG